MTRRATAYLLAAWLIAMASVGQVLAGIDGRGDGFRLLQLSGHYLKWGRPEPGTGATVSYAFVEQPVQLEEARNCGRMVSMDVLASLSGLTRTQIAEETRAAFQAWEAVADIRFLSEDDPGRADILIGAQQQPLGRAFANVTYHSEGVAGVRRIRQSLICLNPQQAWKVGFDGDTDVYDLRYTLIHEIGHAIGLNHAGPEGQIMSFRYQEEFRTPQAGDIRGAAMLYGPAREERLAEGSGR
ncbi:MAG: matrixin family metalloprotease [Ectothiorhodospiraceae bacterium]|nr:matrixin family metalloprotease [Ectothiorhodospiraceae bacterium]MCH8505987.1 matrixin family metalloprotease [Ectothiorhodospiraceae bacterium]